MGAALQAKAEARDLDADLEICEAATAGPWIAVESGAGVLTVNAPDDFELMTDIPFDEDAQFISEAREGWPYAIRRAQDAERENDRLRNELNILQEQARCFD